MALMILPNEILEYVIASAHPDAFEGLALTCKRLYELSRPLIQRHNDFRHRFRDFEYKGKPFRRNVVAASDLIKIIAAEPIVATHILSADLALDSRFLLHVRAYGEEPKSVPSIDEGGAVVDLFAQSTHLRQAGLDWKEYYETFRDDVINGRYSQHGVAFLLTLLANVQKLKIPIYWESTNATDRLLNALVDKARPSIPSQSSSLGSVTKVTGYASGQSNEPFYLSWISSLLALPNIKSFTSISSLAVSENPRTLAFQDSHYIAENLQAAYLGCCCIDYGGITDFLRHTPYLKTFSYSHRSMDHHPTKDWDMCKFINAVVREAGSHLIEFSVSIIRLDGSLVPGKALLRGLQKVEKLEYPLELVMCNINAAGIGGYLNNFFQRLLPGSEDQFVQDLIPPSVEKLALQSEEKHNHQQALVALFRNLRAIRWSQLPALKEIIISQLDYDSQGYENLCNRIVAAGNAVGVEVELSEYYRSLIFDPDTR